MSKFSDKCKTLWAEYAPTHESHVIWMARLHAAAGFLWMLTLILIDVLHSNMSLFSAFTDNQSLVAEAQIFIGVAYEVGRRYKADDLS